ncbi:transmembrane protein 108 isoform X1 [Gadus morhua]|uniref:transmembrane protein 108 isoform X1 n=1 Tax=Gadus morhua TaxID=8049 RepID=UPI0011B67954|nr:transmembrane protein 108-like isoform X1 [Gadus morhua]
MEGGKACPPQPGAREGGRSERLCTREEWTRRRNPSGAVAAEGAGPGRKRSSTSSPPLPCFSHHDDRSSAASGLDVVDRLTYLEQRMQMQEDEIQLLKMTLADVLKRLNVSEEHQASTSSSGGRRTPGAKGSRPVSLVLPPRNPMGNPHAASLKKSTTMPSSGMGRNYTSSPTPSKSSVKDSGCKASKTRPPSAASTCKTAADSSGGHPARDPSLTVGSRRVTHCKVTMQIYLSPPARRTGSSDHEAPPAPTTSFFTSSTTIASGSNRSSSSSSGPTGGAGGPPPMTPGAGQGHRGGSSRSEGRRTRPGFTLNLQKTPSGLGQDTSSYKSPLKSPSQYFQICY